MKGHTLLTRFVWMGAAYQEFIYGYPDNKIFEGSPYILPIGLKNIVGALNYGPDAPHIVSSDGGVVVQYEKGSCFILFGENGITAELWAKVSHMKIKGNDCAVDMRDWCVTIARNSSINDYEAGNSLLLALRLLPAIWVSPQLSLLD